VTPSFRSLVRRGLGLQAVALGAIGTVVGLAMLLLCHTVLPLDGLRQSVERAAAATPLVPPIAQLVPTFLPLFFVLLTVVSLATAVVGGGMLGRRSWARPALLAAATLALLVDLAASAALSWHLLAAPSAASSPVAALDSLRYGLVVVVAGAGLAFAVLLVLALRWLASPSAIAEFAIPVSSGAVTGPHVAPAEQGQAEQPETQPL